MVTAAGCLHQLHQLASADALVSKHSAAAFLPAADHVKTKLLIFLFAKAAMPSISDDNLPHKKCHNDNGEVRQRPTKCSIEYTENTFLTNIHLIQTA